MTRLDTQDEVAVVTGAAGGIGHSLANGAREMGRPAGKVRSTARAELAGHGVGNGVAAESLGSAPGVGECCEGQTE